MRLAFPGLMEALAERVTIVAPNSTLASVAAEQFNREQLALGHSSWERPNIHSVNAWMENCWQDARFSSPDSPLLLSSLQERELWRQVIEEERFDLFDHRAMASMAQKASHVIAEYQIPINRDLWSEHADATEFLGWYTKFQKRLKAENWITGADLWRLLPEVIKQHRVAFVALTAVSPGLKSLSRSLGDSVQNVGVTYPRDPVVADGFAFESFSKELDYAARAVRYLIETKRTQSVGVLVSDLATHASELRHVFNAVLYPSSDAGDHVHIQAGNWIDNALISNAMILLELLQPRINHASAGAILRSPFIDGAHQERSLRALADARLHRARELDFSESDIAKAAWDCPILYQILRRIARATASLDESMRLSAWSSTFSDILDIAKWPAIDSPTDAEQSALDRWSLALSELASLGLVTQPVRLSQAVATLCSILSRPSAVGTWSSPIQVMDAGSAEGIEFDYCFALNMAEDARPEAVSPLIPYRLQRLDQVPGSHPDAVLEHRERATRNLFVCAPEVCVTYSGSLAPMVKPYVRIAQADLSSIWSGATASDSFVAADLEQQDDHQAPSLVQVGEVRGGAGIIKSQSLCPFKAFAEYRLNARGEDEASIGFDALERGECVHKALENIWAELGTQQNLKALSDEDLNGLVERHVREAVKEDTASGPIRLQTSLAEQERIGRVVHQWLQIDKARPMPFSVERTEGKLEAELSGLKLNLRMDRVDRLTDGSLVLIDYKSGLQSPGKLEGERPREPQLLVYAAALGESIDGLYFGELKNRKVRPVGHGAQRHFPKQSSIKEHAVDWQDFLHNSQEAVHMLAEEFVRGEAAVMPQKTACDYCKIKPICRVGAFTEEDEE